MKNKPTRSLALSNEPLLIPANDDSHKDKIISVRLDAATVDRIDSIAADSGYSRNQLIKIFLEHSLQVVKLQE